MDRYASTRWWLSIERRLPRGSVPSGPTHCQEGVGLEVVMMAGREREIVRRVGIGECGKEAMSRFLEIASAR